MPLGKPSPSAATHEIETEIAHPSPSGVIDEHVVQVPLGQTGQIGMLDK
jgi:hypothetical protein